METLTAVGTMYFRCFVPVSRDQNSASNNNIRPVESSTLKVFRLFVKCLGGVGIFKRRERCPDMCPICIDVGLKVNEKNNIDGAHPVERNLFLRTKELWN